MAGIGQAQFDATVTQKLPLVATDASVFALGTEIGWSSAWLSRRQIAHQPDVLPHGHEDVAALLTGGRQMLPPAVPTRALPGAAATGPAAAAMVAAPAPPATAAPAPVAPASWFCIVSSFQSFSQSVIQSFLVKLSIIINK